MEVYVVRVPKSVGKVLLAVSRLAERPSKDRGPIAKKPAAPLAPTEDEGEGDGDAP